MCPFELLHGRSEAVADRYPEFSTAEIQEHLFGRRCCFLRERQGVAVRLRACAEIQCREYRSCLLRPARTGTHQLERVTASQSRWNGELIGPGHLSDSRR